MENKPSKSPVIFAVVAWMIINSIFFLLELTIFGDYMDLNNSIELALWLVSIAGILSMRKGGAALVTFTLIYSFSFNAFNVIYFPPARLLNGVSAIINAIVIVFMFRSIFANRFR